MKKGFRLEIEYIIVTYFVIGICFGSPNVSELACELSFVYYNIQKNGGK